VITSSQTSSTPWRSQISRRRWEVAVGRGEAPAGVLHRLDDDALTVSGAGVEDGVCSIAPAGSSVSGR
jgi:hypothetical protein